MLVVSLGGVNHRFRSHLECSRETATILAVKNSSGVAHEEIKAVILLQYVCRRKYSIAIVYHRKIILIHTCLFASNCIF